MVVADYGQPDGLDVDGIRLHRTCGLADGIPVVRFIHPRLTSLWSALGRANADVYYVSCAGPQLGFVVSFARRHGKKVVFRIAHDTDCDPRNLLIRFWRDKKIYEYGLRRADRILAQSSQQARALESNYGLISSVAAMLVDPPASDKKFDQRDVDVLWVNNLRPFKRPDLFLELARRVPKLRFHMIGGPQSGHEALFNDISEQACKLPNVVFHGRVAYHDVNDFYERTKVFVNTSDSEGFPNSYLQAWRRGTPTVVFFDPDSIISRNEIGVVADSIQEMVDSVLELINSRASWQLMHDRCISFMDANYADEAVLAPYIDALRC
jgi:glycosyltransferase involved in cell wall biosynthesis